LWVFNNKGFLIPSPFTIFQVEGERREGKRSSCLKPKAEFAASPKRSESETARKNRRGVLLWFVFWTSKKGTICLKIPIVFPMKFLYISPVFLFNFDLKK